MLAVSMTGISKRYGTVQALNSVSLNIEKGTIHAVVGENGAGKTTLMRALYGAMIPDQGTIELTGKLTEFKSSADAIAAKIGMVSQHYGIIGELSNLENLILGSESNVLNPSSLKQKAQQLADKMGFQFEWEQESQLLSPASAQKLEILKLLWKEAQIMILDEPTAMLGPEDANALFASLTRLASEGATIILVTHRLPEVFEYCSKVTILRAGVKVGEHNVSEVTAEQLAQEIVGGDVIERIPPTSSNQEAFPPLVKLSGISAKGSKGQLAVKKVDLSLRQGKIIGIAGVDGSGQRELFRVLIGIQNQESGSITYHVNDIEKEWTKANTAERIQDGLRIIPEDRHHEAVIEDWSLIENAKLGLQRIPQLIPNGTQIQEFAHTISERFSTKHGGLKNPMSSLSGGNQQRFVAARALQVSPKIILAFQPARGLDLNSTTKVYQAMREECKQGASALVVSFDLDELLDFCDEIVVMCNGVLTTPSQRDRTEIGRLMVNG